MIKLVFCLFFVGLGFALVAKEHVTKIEIPSAWRRLDAADPNAELKLTFAITQRNVDLVEELFWKVSDPQDPLYAKYLTLEELNLITAPDQKNVDKVINWLNQYNIKTFNITRGKEFIVAVVPVRTAESMLSTQFFNFLHQTSGMKLIRSSGPYYVPEELDSCLDFIGGVVRFPRVKKLQVRAQPGANTITPSVIQQTFGIPAGTKGQSSSSSQAVAQFLGQYYNPSDLSSFQTQMGLKQQPVDKVVGTNDPTNPGPEASLDIEYIIGVAPGITTWFVSTDGEYQQQEPFLDWITFMINTTTAPWVHSVSYGDEENSVSLDYMKRVNTEFVKFGLLGRSILFASGDDGVGCTTSCSSFVANWPASSPYVTAVGGFDTSEVGDSISSGGFSTYFQQKVYQQNAVKGYLSKGGLPPAHFYNVSGRAIPDVSGFSENVQIFNGGIQFGVGGTSCAAPAWAAVVTLLNDARFVQGKPSLGFLNPFLYQTFASHPDAFHDITSGNNANGCCPGFDAKVGWDPITGLGYPNFPNLVKYAVQA